MGGTGGRGSEGRGDGGQGVGGTGGRGSLLDPPEEIKGHHRAKLKRSSRINRVRGLFHTINDRLSHADSVTSWLDGANFVISGVTPGQGRGWPRSSRPDQGAAQVTVRPSPASKRGPVVLPPVAPVQTHVGISFSAHWTGGHKRHDCRVVISQTHRLVSQERLFPRVGTSIFIDLIPIMPSGEQWF